MPATPIVREPADPTRHFRKIAGAAGSDLPLAACHWPLRKEARPPDAPSRCIAIGIGARILRRGTGGPGAGPPVAILSLARDHPRELV